MARKSRYVAYTKKAKCSVKGVKKQEPVKAPAGAKGERK